MKALGKYLLGVCCLLSLGHGFAQDYHLRLKKIGGLRKATIMQGDSIGFTLKSDSFLAYPTAEHKYFATATDPFPEAKWYLKKVDSGSVVLIRPGEYMYDTLVRGQNKPKYDNYKVEDWEIAQRIGTDTVIARKRTKTDELKIYLDDFESVHRIRPAEPTQIAPGLGIIFSMAGLFSAAYPFFTLDSSFHNTANKRNCCLVGSLLITTGIALIAAGIKEYDFDMAEWRLIAKKDEVEKTNEYD